MIKKIPILRQRRSSKFDQFFSKSLELKPVAAALFRCFLPEGPSAYAKQEALTRIDRVRTNAKLEQRRRDIAYEMDTEELGKFLLCLEHQSSPDELMIARELYYVVDNIATYLAEREPVPSIVNLILYHGAPSPQPYPIHPEDCFGRP
ncbi:MAG: Rpn family recombination-promoting nuclease/putative transposase, partial [Bacteroidota bacterium]